MYKTFEPQKYKYSPSLYIMLLFPFLQAQTLTLAQYFQCSTKRYKIRNYETLYNYRSKKTYKVEQEREVEYLLLYLCIF